MITHPHVHLGRWRELAKHCADADPAEVAAPLATLPYSAGGWVIPSGRRPDHYLFAAMIATAKAFAAQDSIRARVPICDPLKGLAEAVGAVLERAAPEADPPRLRRHRADVDD